MSDQESVDCPQGHSRILEVKVGRFVGGVEGEQEPEDFAPFHVCAECGWNDFVPRPRRRRP